MSLKASILLLIPLVVFSDKEPIAPFWLFFNVGVLATFSLLVFGAFWRPIAKAMYHEHFEDRERMRNNFSRSPTARLIWWIDEEGRDRDA